MVTMTKFTALAPTVMALTAIAITATACSASTSTGRQVAHLPGHHAHGTAATRLTQAQSDQDMVDFARCVRAHGVPIADPSHRPGHAGLSIDLPSDTTANRPALTACSHFLAPIVAAKDAGGPAQAARQLPALTRYARCMRSHDIAMEDPTPDGSLNLGTVPGITANYGRYSPQFRAADTACRHLLPAGVHDDGTGP
jgi:hypothetical protein